MTSAASSMPEKHRERVSLRQRSRIASRPTSAAADEALQQVMRRRAQKRDGRLPPRQSAMGTDRANLLAAVARASSGIGLIKIVVLTVAGIAMWAGLSLRAAAPLRGTPHRVQGVLMLDGKPLAHSLVEFHRLDAAAGRGGAVEVASTDAGGAFAFGTPQTPGLPAGTYAVVARARRRVERGGESVLESVALPKAYASPAATPLRVVVPADASLQLVIRR